MVQVKKKLSFTSSDQHFPSRAFEQYWQKHKLETYIHIGSF